MIATAEFTPSKELIPTRAHLEVWADGVRKDNGWHKYKVSEDKTHWKVIFSREQK